MKLYFGPEVYFVGKQAVNDGEVQRFLADHGFMGWDTEAPSPAAKLVEVAARNCYQSFKKGRPHQEHVDNLKSSMHGSCLEHAVWNFLVVGMSRANSHELVRHRQGTAFSQLSQRYVDSSETAFVVPPALAGEVKAAIALLEKEWPAGPGWTPGNFGLYEVEDALDCKYTDEEQRSGLKWLRSCLTARDDYSALSAYLSKRDAGKFENKTAALKDARQAARSVLPNAAETKMFLTLNARAARHFCEMRASRHADAEIRLLANRVFGLLVEESPSLFSDYKVEPLDVGFEVSTAWRKV